MRGRGALLTIGCLAIGITGCGESKLETGRLESQIQKSLSERTGLPIQSVSCPKDVKAKEGDTFQCVATTAGRDRVVVDVTQEDSEGRVTWRVSPPAPAGK